MKLRDLYAEYVANYISSGSLIVRSKLSSLGLKATFDRFLTKKYVTKTWHIDFIPVNFDYNLTQVIREKMHLKFPDVKTVVHLNCRPTKVQVTRDIFTRQMATAEENYLAYKGIGDEMSESEKSIGKVLNLGRGRRLKVRRKDIQSAKDIFDSYNYVYNHTMTGADKNMSGEFFRVAIFIQASFKDKDEIKNYSVALDRLLRAMGVSAIDLRGKISNYLSAYAPAGYSENPEAGFVEHLMSDENIAAILPTKTSGLVSPKGILHGIDVLSKLPLWVNYFASSSAQVIMILAKSGMGKTLIAQLGALFFMSRNHHVQAMDLKGGEWEVVYPYVSDYLEIDVSASSKRYVNVFRLDDMPVTADNCLQMYEEAIEAGIGLLSIPINLQDSDQCNIVDVHSLLREAIKKTYTQISGFNERNPHTYKLTNQVRESAIIDNLNSLQEVKSYPENLRKLIPTLVSRLRNIYGDQESGSTDFKDEITLSQIISSQLVVYVFHKNKSKFVDIKEEMRLFMLTHLGSKKHHVRKLQDLHTVEIFEEFTRAKNIAARKGPSQFVNHISQVTTGSRSDNVTVMILANSLEPFDGDQDTAAIASNITTFIVGKIAETDHKKLIDKFNLESLSPYINTICEDEESNFNNVFAIKYDNGVEVKQAMFKAILPDHMLEEMRQRSVADSPIS